MNNTSSNTRVALIYDDHELFSSSFSVLMQQTGMFSEVHTFNNESDVTQFVLQTPLKEPYIFCDYFVPGSNTTHLIFNIKKFCPSAKIVMVSSISSVGLIKKILSYKVDGFIGKTDGVQEITACLAAIAKKQVYLSASVQEVLNNNSGEDMFFDFSPREMEVLMHSSWGKSIDEIAEELNLSKATIITHRRNLLSKSGLHSFTQLVALSIRSGIVPDK